MNGPVPTGLLLYATWLMFGYCASRCFGNTGNGAAPIAKNVAMNGAKGRLRWTTAVYLSGSSMRRIRSYPVRVWTLLLGFIAACHENTTSSALNGTPSCHVTPRRKWYVIVRPSREIPPLAGVGTVVASSGTNRLRSS